MELRHHYRCIELSTWKRRAHFGVFGRGDYPYDGVTTTVDVTKLLDACRDNGIRFFNAFLYVVTRAMNEVENFRYRMYEDQVILCDQTDPSFNVLDEPSELFYFAYAEFTPDFPRFDSDVEAAKAVALDNKHLGSNRLDVFYVSRLPWFGFSDIIQPMGLSANDSIPRLVWGRYQKEGERVVMPFSVTSHHGFVDGLHIARLLEKMEELLDRPERWTGAAASM
ncbi:MAG: hypothetical protein LUE17_01495 [Planctomycetaceae bacterium]|nr:hypothetical protein [Planctomycetaceae bacterium]